MARVNFQQAIEELAAYALYSRSREEYRELLLTRVIELLGFDAGMLWQSDGTSSSMARPLGIRDDLGAEFPGYVAELSPSEIKLLVNARSVSDSVLFSSAARREQLSLYNKYLRPNKIAGFVSRSWFHEGALHIIAFCKGARAHDYDREASRLDVLFPVIALGEARFVRTADVELPGHSDDVEEATKAVALARAAADSIGPTMVQPSHRGVSEAGLSPRERQVVAFAALGRTNKEIAHELGLAHSTVRVLLTRAAQKLRARTRAELTQRFVSTMDVNIEH